MIHPIEDLQFESSHPLHIVEMLVSQSIVYLNERAQQTII